MGIPKIRVKPTKSVALCLFASVVVGVGSSSAHQTLYHNIEVYLHDRAIVRILVTVHAPELPSGVAAGIAPSAVEDNWLPMRSNAELAALFQEADRFIRETFAFGIVDPGESPPKPIDPDSLPLVFETPEQIRDPNYDNGLPVGCLLVTFEFQNPGAPKKLALTFSPTAEKRLLLAVARPGQFPEVHDLAAAESLQIELPEAPPRKKRIPYAAIVFLSAVAFFSWLASRRKITR